jgi:hypothetical protein
LGFVITSLKRGVKEMANSEGARQRSLNSFGGVATQLEHPAIGRLVRKTTPKVLC